MNTGTSRMRARVSLLGRFIVGPSCFGSFRDPAVQVVEVAFLNADVIELAGVQGLVAGHADRPVDLGGVGGGEIGRASCRERGGMGGGGGSAEEQGKGQGRGEQ